MFQNILLLFRLFSILLSFLTSTTTSTPTRFPPNRDGFTASLIPPTSPRSPFYTQLLAANNLPTTPTNQTLTLTRTHIQTWVETNQIHQNPSKNDYSDITYNKNAFFYVMELYIGDPEQLVYGIFDTGSDITWVQCEGRARKTRLPYYNESKSHTYKVVKCYDTNWCRTKRGDMGCSSSFMDHTLCEYNLGYLDGSFSKGLISSDVFTFKPDWEVIPDFVFGCSEDNPSRLPGIIGASNNVYSMVKQTYPSNPIFSYCISGSATKTNLVRFGSDAVFMGKPVRLLRHPRRKYYYMFVIGIQVNGVNIKVNPSEYRMSSDGSNGFIIDSGHSVSSLKPVVFDALKDSISRILGTPTKYSVFEICYPRSKFGSVWPYKPRPKIGINFENWVFEWNVSNAWLTTANAKLECLYVTRAKNSNISVLGATQLFDVNVGHDLENNLLFLEPMVCPTD